MLVIATPNPDSVAETFIRQHIRLILPGKTAVIYFEGGGNSVKDLPRLRIKPNTSHSKISSLKNLVVHGYAGAVVGEQADRVIHFLTENNVRCVLAEFGQTACALQVACRRAGVPLYVFFHGQDASSAGRHFRNRYSYRRMARYATKAFVQTAYFSKTVRRAGIPSNKIIVAPSGLDVDAFSPAAARDPELILAVSRMVEKKAPQLTIRAFAKTARLVPGARLEMVGDGPLLDRAKETAESLGIGDRVVFHGARDNEFVRKKMSKATLFVQHSITAANGDTESLGITLLEAMACEVPLVVTRHNGFVETVDDGVTGYLVDEHDVDGMADRMTELMTDRPRRENMGRAGRQRVIERYDSRRQARLLRDFLGLSLPTPASHEPVSQ